MEEIYIIVIIQSEQQLLCNREMFRPTKYYYTRFSSQKATILIGA